MPGGDEVGAEAPNPWALGSQPGRLHIRTYGHRCRTQGPGPEEKCHLLCLVWPQRHLREAFLTPAGGRD